MALRRLPEEIAMTSNWNKQTRDALLRAYDQAAKDHHDAWQRTEDMDFDEACEIREPLQEERERRLQAYWDLLPQMPLSACPLCGEQLVRSFDQVGIEGFFWQEGMRVEQEEPTTCPHFCVLLGAVNLNGLPPRGGINTAHVGPEVPYVIPRLLSLPGMVAVISTVPLENGYTTYPIAYFAETPPDPFELTQPWTRRTFSYKDKHGKSWWTEKNDPWDFELAPWVSTRQVQWIAPGDASFRVASAPEPCPYVGLPGRRRPLEIVENELREGVVPDGRELGTPFE